MKLLELYVFILAAFTGFMVISRVPPLLHTPLMALKTQDGAEAEALVAATRRLFALPEPETAPEPVAEPEIKRSGG